MPNITIQPKKVIEYLNVNIGDETYKIPLAKYLKIGEASKLDNNKAIIDFFKTYLSEEVVNALTFDDLAEIAEAWKSASVEGGTDVKKS